MTQICWFCLLLLLSSIAIFEYKYATVILLYQTVIKFLMSVLRSVGFNFDTPTAYSTWRKRW